MVFPSEASRPVEVMTAAAAAASSSSPSPPAHRPLVMRGKPRSRHPISPLRAAWTGQRLVRCVRVDGTDAGAGEGERHVPARASSPPVSSSERKPETVADDGFERIRAKLMDHLREAVGRIELPAVMPAETWRNQPPAESLAEADEDGGHGDGDGDVKGSGESPPSSSPAHPSPVVLASAPPAAGGAVAAEELPWNLRTRKPTSSGNGRQPYPIPSCLMQSPSPSAPAKSSRLRSGATERRDATIRKRRPRFSVPLTKEEIDEDLYAFTGRRASRRPKKRPRIVQKQLDMLFPGLWLSEVTADLYHVADPPPPPPPS